MYERVENILKMAEESNTSAIAFICMDDTMARSILVGLQKRQHIDASHSLAHTVYRPTPVLLLIVHFRRNGKHLLYIPVHRI